MALLADSLDLSQGFKYVPTSKQPFGYLATATILGTALAADIQGFDPLTQTAQGVVGVLSNDTWAGGAGDPISVIAYLSAQNKQRVSSLLQAQVATTAVTFDLVTYQYDPVVQRFCKRFWAGTPPLQGMVQKQGASLSISLDSAAVQVGGVQASGMSLTMVPAPKQQTLTYATSCQNKVTRPWGVMLAS